MKKEKFNTSNTSNTNTNTNTKSSNASSELTKSLNDLNDEVIGLAVQSNDTTKQANNLETAFDITTDSTLDLAKAENDLTKSINTKNDAVNQSIETNDSLNVSQQELLELEKEYQKTLKRKLDIEQKLNKQRQIIKYSDNLEKVPDYVQKEPSYNLNQHLEDNNLSDLKKYKAELEKTKKEQGTFKKISNKSISNIGNFAKTALSKGGSLLENVMGLQQIPLYNESKQLTQGLIKKSSKGISNIGSGIKEKLIERKFNKEKEKSTKEFYSNNNSSKENNFNAERNQNQVLVQQKEERNQNKTERDKSNTRHNEHMKSLSVITDVLRENALFGKLGILFFSSIFGGIGSLITGIGGIATAIAGLGATIIAGFKGAIGGMLNKLWPGKFPDLEDVDIDKSKNKNGDIDKAKSPNKDIDKSKSPSPNDIDKAKSPNNDIDKTKSPNDIDFKDGKEKPIDVDKSKSKSPKKAGESVFKKIGKQGLKSIGLRALGAATGVGGAMLTAEAAYYMLDSATDGKFSESTDNLINTMSPENKPLDKIGAIQSGTLSESERAHLGKEQADKIEKERADLKERNKEAFNLGFKNNMNMNNQNNNIYMSGFHGLTPNIHKQVPSYGVTSG